MLITDFSEKNNRKNVCDTSPVKPYTDMYGALVTRTYPAGRWLDVTIRCGIVHQHMSDVNSRLLP